ncbi:hypothetical protein ACFQXA_18745 [Nocardiopsis composta]
MADPIPFLFPGDPLRPRRVDGFFADEHAAALKAGAEAFLVDHDALVRGDLREAVRGCRAGWGRSATGAGWCRRPATPSSPGSWPSAAAARRSPRRTTGAPTSCPAGTRCSRR